MVPGMFIYSKMNSSCLNEKWPPKTEHSWVGIHPLYIYIATVDGQVVTAKTWWFSFTKPFRRRCPVDFPGVFRGSFFVVGRQLRQITRKLCQCFVAMNPTLWVSTPSQMPKKPHPKPGERIFLSKNICISWDWKLSHRMKMKKFITGFAMNVPQNTARKIPSCWLHVGGIYSKQHPNKKGHGDMTNIANL